MKRSVPVIREETTPARNPLLTVVPTLEERQAHGRTPRLDGVITLVRKLRSALQMIAQTVARAGQDRPALNPPTALRLAKRLRTLHNELGTTTAMIDRAIVDLETTATGSSTWKTIPTDTPQLSIAALVEFTKLYARTEAPLREARTKDLSDRIKALKPRLAAAKSDEFRRLMMQMNAALSSLDAVAQDVVQAVLDEIDPSEQSPLYAVWRSMRRTDATQPQHDVDQPR